MPQALQVLPVLRVPKVSKEMRGLQAQLVPRANKVSKVPQALQDRPGQPVLQASWALLARLVPKVLQAQPVLLRPWPAQLVQPVPKAQLVLHLR